MEAFFMQHPAVGTWIINALIGLVGTLAMFYLRDIRNTLKDIKHKFLRVFDRLDIHERRISFLEGEHHGRGPDHTVQCRRDGDHCMVHGSIIVKDKADGT